MACCDFLTFFLLAENSPGATSVRSRRDSTINNILLWAKRSKSPSISSRKDTNDNNNSLEDNDRDNNGLPVSASSSRSPSLDNSAAAPWWNNAKDPDDNNNNNNKSSKKLKVPEAVGGTQFKAMRSHFEGDKSLRPGRASSIGPFKMKSPLRIRKRSSVAKHSSSGGGVAGGGTAKAKAKPYKKKKHSSTDSRKTSATSSIGSQDVILYKTRRRSGISNGN